LRRAGLALAAVLLAGAANGEDAGPPGRALFRWPLIGKIVKPGDGRGVDIVVPEGQAVHAAGDGTVLYASDELKSFGKMIVIRHADDFVTAYANLSEMAVAAGVKVKRGQIIGKSGKTGETNGPKLHFELRKGGATVDPLGYLAPR
jgi:murein DD-endopeptidase MepM/ murein hydrolase activator NlpD